MNLTRLVQLFLVVIFSFGLLLFPGCAEKKDDEKDAAKSSFQSQSSFQKGGVYRVPLMNSPTTLDPAHTQDIYGIWVIHQLFDRLVKFDHYLTVLPALAETWEVDDNGKVYRFVLRKNAEFHNGRPITSSDVMFSISRLLRVEPPPVIVPHLLKIVGAKDYKSSRSDHIRGIEIVDDHIFRIHMEEPNAPFLTALGMYQAAIVPKEEIVQLGEQFWQEPVGSGPFRFVSWKRDESIRLKRFSDYHSGESLLDGIIYKIYPGSSIERVMEDFLEVKLEEMPAPGIIREKLSENNELQLFHRPSLGLFFYGINCSHPYLKNADIRRALSMAINREKLVQEVYGGQVEPARAILPTGMPGYRRQNEIVIEDNVKAREFVKTIFGKAATSPYPLEIVSVEKSPFAEAELNFIRDSWARLGISLRVKYITDWKKFTEYRKSDSMQIYRASWSADMPDPDNFLHPLFSPDSPVNYMRYSNDKVNRMLQTARGIIDPVKRVEMYQQIEDIILESFPLIPLFYLSVYRVYQSNVRGIQVSALGAHTMPLNRVWLKPSTQP